MGLGDIAVGVWCALSATEVIGTTSLQDIINFEKFGLKKPDTFFKDSSEKDEECEYFQ